MDMSPNFVAGYVAPGFERVKEEFERNFIERGEVGAACTIFHRGEKVIDLTGGYRCQRQQTPWTDDTLSLSFSVTKGMAAAAMAVAHSRNYFELDAPVAEYWPEFAQAGKRGITVRQLLSHQAGLVATNRRLETDQIADLDGLAKILAKQAPLWQPGLRHGYHTLTLGWYQNELLRRTDPQGRSLGQFFEEEIATPLGVEFYIGVPEHVDTNRLSTIEGFHRTELLSHLRSLPARMVLSGAWPWSLVAKSIRVLNAQNPAVLGDPEFRKLEIPSANGIGTAAAVAKIYSVLAGGGTELGLQNTTFQELVAPAISPIGGPQDMILKLDTRYTMGFSRPSEGLRFGRSPAAFGCPGAGGSFGMADPAIDLGYAYLTNKMGFCLFDDPRERAVREACYECIQSNPAEVRFAA